MADMIPTGLACPRCKAEGKTGHPLYNALGRYGSFCITNPDHIYRDMGELMAMNPDKVAITKQPKAPDPGVVAVTFQLSGKLRDGLMLRFGEKLGPTVSFILGSLLEFGSFIVSESDAIRMKEHIGEEVRNASDLVGKVYEMRQKVLQLQRDLDILQNTKGGGKGLNVDLGVDTLMAVGEKAKFNGMTIEQMAANIIETGLKNQWV